MMSYSDRLKTTVSLNNKAVLNLVDGSYDWSQVYDVLISALACLNNDNTANVQYYDESDSRFPTETERCIRKQQQQKSQDNTNHDTEMRDCNGNDSHMLQSVDTYDGRDSYSNDINVPPQQQLLPDVTYDWIDFSPQSSSQEDGTYNYHHHHQQQQQPNCSCTCTATLISHLVVKINISEVECRSSNCLAAPPVASTTLSETHDAKIRWAINYNLAVLIQYVASCIGEGRGGNILLKQAHMYYTTSQLTFPAINAPHKDCFRLLLVSQNNLSCIYLDFGLYDEHISSLVCLAQLIIDLRQTQQQHQSNSRNNINGSVYSYPATINESSEDNTTLLPAPSSSLNNNFTASLNNYVFSNSSPQMSNNYMQVPSSPISLAAEARTTTTTTTTTTGNNNQQYGDDEDSVNHKIFLNLLVLSRFHILASAA